MDRSLPRPSTAGRDAFRELDDRLSQLERQWRDFVTGNRPVGGKLTIGDVEIAVEATSPTGRTVRFTNQLTGVSDTIVL